MIAPAAGQAAGGTLRRSATARPPEEIIAMTGPGWYMKEQIEHELDRLGAQTWRFQDDQSRFRDEEKAAPADVELASDVYGAVLGKAPAVLDTLSHLQDGIGDERIAEALFRQTDFERR
jgi:hypothetical protein